MSYTEAFARCFKWLMIFLIACLCARGCREFLQVPEHSSYEECAVQVEGVA